MPTGLHIRRLRVLTGLILFAFAASHFLNHALGLHSAHLMEVGQTLRWSVTRSGTGTAILLAAAFIHMALGLYKFIARRTLRMSVMEGMQLAFGLAIPLLLIPHVLQTRGAYEAFGFNDFYAPTLAGLWPDKAARQGALMLLVWVHGSIGLHLWLRMSPLYRKAMPWLLALAVLIPALGYLGFVSGAREVTGGPPPQTLGDFEAKQIAVWTDFAYYGFASLLGMLILFRLARAVTARFGNTITVAYVGGPTVRTHPGPSLLEISRHNGIPHASICGGRARCSTCRVRVVDGLEDQPAANATEARLLSRVGARDASMRLACQMRPRGDLRIIQLLPAERITAAGVDRLDRYDWGMERGVTVMFSDMRGFTQFSEHRLPYDVVFILNRYLDALSGAIVAEGGYVDKFMGDGVMAIFGMTGSERDGARSALRAAVRMLDHLEEVNHTLAENMDEPLTIGIGIHSGHAVLGRIGSAKLHDAGNRITALGDTVNTASRLENATKEHGASIAVSGDSVRIAGIALPDQAKGGIPLRGKKNDVTAYLFRDGKAISDALAEVP